MTEYILLVSTRSQNHTIVSRGMETSILKRERLEVGSFMFPNLRQEVEIRYETSLSNDPKEEQFPWVWKLDPQ